MLAIPLGFPRSTQTPTVALSDASCNTQPPVEVQAVGSQTHEVVSCCNATQTQLVETCCNATQTDCEPSSSNSRNLSVERESSPFVSLFAPSTSTRVVNSTSLLFPSAISHVLLAGASAGTKENFLHSQQIRPAGTKM